MIVTLEQVKANGIRARRTRHCQFLDAVDGGAWMKGYEFSLSGPIYAGTNEIQRNVVAERVLGLPRK